jgi:hypothetical protein
LSIQYFTTILHIVVSALDNSNDLQLNMTLEERLPAFLAKYYPFDSKDPYPSA